jgi:hypothetical protein
VTPDEQAKETFDRWVAQCYADFGHVAVFEQGADLKAAIAAAIRAAENDALERAAKLMHELYSDEEANHIRALRDDYKYK